MDTVRQDLRYAVRSFLRTPRLTFAALACIALGVGAAVFIITLANAVLLERLPFPDAERLVRVWTVQQESGRRSDVSYPDVLDLRARTSAFDAIEVAARTRTAIMTAEGAERMRGESVSPGYFGLIGLQPALGRLFTEAEYVPGAERVMLISHAMWQRKFGGRPDIVGTTLRARGAVRQDAEQLFTVVGVLPAGFAGTVDYDVSDFWLPIEQYAPRMLLERRSARMVWVMARLAPGATMAGAQAEVAALGQQLAAEHPQLYPGIALAVEPVGEISRARFRGGLLLLSAAAVLLLLIACTNIANLLLSRLASRGHELTLRAALGAGRGRILRQLATECLLLAAAGGVAGTALAWWGIRRFANAQLFQLPGYMRITPDAGTLALALGIVLGACLLFGVLPVILGARLSASQQLREAGRTTTPGRRQRRAADALVIAEVMFSFVLLVASVLLLRTYGNLVRSELGFRTENVLRMAVSLDPAVYPGAEAQLAFAREARAVLAAQPGVRAVSFMAGVLPPWFDPDVQLARDGEPSRELTAIQRHAIDETFLDVLDISVLHGRGILASDHARGARVALVSESLARALAGGNASAAVGTLLQTVRAADRNELSEPMHIVGVVEDVRYHGPLTDRRIDHDLYVPMTQAPDEVLSIAIHTSVDAATLIEPLQRALGRLAPTSPQHWISTMDGELALQYGNARVYAWLTGVFGASALILAVLGIYGVLSHVVARRFTELGVRMAVGARSKDLAWLVVREGARTVVLGLALGAALALIGLRTLTALVYGITPTDPLSFLAVAAGLLICGLAASWLPARRAGRIDPMIVLRGH